MKKLITVLIIISFSFSSFSQKTGTFTDPRDGKTYKTVKIGDQVWMAENLNYVTKDCWCYDNDTSNCKQYGRLYTWEAAKSACPPDWHLPSKTEYESLLVSIGGKGRTAYNSLKQGGSSNFSTLFAGFRLDNDLYLGLGISTNFWSSTQISENSICNLIIDIKNPDTQIGYFDKEIGYSVRCLKDN
jgi:uncharacterized protein (TIGR02145 family)